MDTRRDFVKKAAMLSGAAGLSALLPASVLKAMSINPAQGSSYLDAEHIVVLMQENRSFDHCFGALKGVRGFNDPRAITLPTGNPVWFQQNAAGNTFVPFRLNIKDTRATWIGSLPHSWTNQADARNGGKYDRWLDVKHSGNEDFADVPLTMGYYNRLDLPFYYALADAFTICDQNFCSSLTGTTPNRLHLWTGTLRTDQKSDAPALVRNENIDYDREANWHTFPEHLEENGISWKIYQNEISLSSGLNGEEDSWLTNFTDNPIEWFAQYNVRFSKSHITYIENRFNILPSEIKALETKAVSLIPGSKSAAENRELIEKKRQQLKNATEERVKWKRENFAKLSQKERNLHEKAFTTNEQDPDYRKLYSMHYNDNGTQREVKVPKGDVLYQFREDVNKGALPVVSWLVAPENFSDHPSAPWYGAWYVSEVLDILTKNPETWKKTIFILCYDENDGYFDHIPPFVPPHPTKPRTGKVSKGIDPALEYVMLENDKKLNPDEAVREGPLGLGYRVPLVVASPWSRGGTVCSQVFDHTSILMFMEQFLSHKTGKNIRETNISAWRRAICGDLTAVFKPYNGETINFPPALDKDNFIAGIHSAKFKKDPSGYKALNAAEIKEGRSVPAQEKGIKPATALPYQLCADGKLNPGQKRFELSIRAGNEIFGTRAAGAPFIVYSHEEYPRNYAVAAGDELSDTWDLDHENAYKFKIYGPNGFFRSFTGNKIDPLLKVTLDYEWKDSNTLTGNIVLGLSGIKPLTVHVIDNAYEAKEIVKTIAPQDNLNTVIDLSLSHNWYDISIKVQGYPEFEQRYAGRVETGKEGFTDPGMGVA